MRELVIPRHLPWVEAVGLALSSLAFLVPDARTGPLVGLVAVLYFYCVFWTFVDAHQSGQLNKTIPQIYQEAKRSPRRTRLVSAAFAVAGGILIMKYL